ncbi:MAG: ATP-binding protein [Opitutales bacterium]|nr:ATP-binding protein [Opitutales bacterium]
MNTIAEEQDISANLQGVTPRSTWKFSLDAVNQNTKHYSAEARELLRWAFMWCNDVRHPIRWEDFSKRVGYSDNTLWKIYNGTYKHPTTKELMQVPDKLIESISKFRQMESERAMLGEKQFVMTPTAKSIFDHFDLIRESQTPGFLYGASQIGKTTTAMRYKDLRNHGQTAYVRLGASSGLHGMLQLISMSVGVSPKSNTKQLLARIKNAITPDMLLIIDEAHQLIFTYRKESFFACVEVLREIYDETQCGLALIMTNLGRDKWTRDRRMELEQMFRRGVHILELGEMPSMSDLKVILKAQNLEWPNVKMKVDVEGETEEPFAMLRQLARNEGLKAIVERVRYGRKIASMREEELDWRHVCEAHLILKAKSTAPAVW